MRLQISHETILTFETPVHYAVQTVRLTPRGSSQQFVNDWRIDVSADCRLTPVEDPYGNWTHTFSVDGPLTELTVTAGGEVLTEETNGVIRGTPERLPLAVYLRSTPLTAADARVSERAIAIRTAGGGDILATLHGVMDAIHSEIAPETAAEPGANPTGGSDYASSPGATLAAGKGSAADRSHLFVAAARALDIPARLVCGYVFEAEASEPTSAIHCWAEAHVGGTLGWIGFDPTLNLCPTEHHIRLSTGLDHLDAIPLRAAGLGGYRPKERVTIHVSEIVGRRPHEIVE